MVRLVISDNEGTTTVVPLLRDEITIGRKEGNTIRLTERNISRQHAHLVKQNGVYKLRDLDSYNGVLVNGQRVQGESAINTGDQIQIGDYTILVEEEAPKVVAADEPTTVAKRPVIPARFVMLSEPSPGAEFALPPDRTARLGRSEDVDCPINHRSVSREHAEVLVENGVYTLRDLGSANGVTVNGVQVKERPLKAGDVVELGQVAFRYVEPGEHYLFDAAEAARYRGLLGARRGANLRTAAIVLGAALVIAIVVVLSGGEEAPQEATVTALPGTQPSAATLTDDGYDKAVRACTSALQGSRFAEALAHATLALKVRPGATEAAECQTQAQLRYEDEQAYVRGKAALAAGDVDAAQQEFARFSAGSEFLARPEVVEARERAARSRLAKARSLVATSPAEAARLAQSVIDMSGAPSALVNMAEQVLAEAQKQASAVASAPTRPSAPRAAASRASSPAPQPRAAPAPSGVSPMDVASACLARGDNDCVIRALAGRASTAQELGLLIETYRATGDTKQAQKNMATYVKRFPTARRADAYKRMLELQGQ